MNPLKPKKSPEPSKTELASLGESGLAAKPVDSFDGREFISKGKKYIDFSGTNYLSFDLLPEFNEIGIKAARQTGPLWGSSRLELDSAIYSDLETRLACFLSAKRVHLSHTITLMNFSVIPAIAGKGVIFADKKVHTVVYEAARLARDHGATLMNFEHQNLASLEAQLIAHKDVFPKLILVDGVYSISSALAPIPELQVLARKYGAWLYVDDAHGFGILGRQGRGVVNHFDGDYDRTFYVTSFGKAFCTHTSFITIPSDFHEPLEFLSLSNIYSAPISPYAIGLAQAALDLNERIGDEHRKKLRGLTAQLVQGLRSLGFQVENHENQPIVFVPIGNLKQLKNAAFFLDQRGIHGGLRAFPVVPRDRCGIRLGLTSGHTSEQIKEALKTFAEVAKLRSDDWAAA